MADLIYTSNVSLDGFVEDDHGSFDADAIRTMKASASGHLTVGGADLARQAFEAGLVDECRLFICPVLVGGGKAALPRDIPVELELIDEHRFGSGVISLRYRIAT